MVSTGSRARAAAAAASVVVAAAAVGWGNSGSASAVIPPGGQPGPTTTTRAPQPASQQTCQWTATSNACFRLTTRFDGNMDVHVGIDLRMSRAAAQAFIDGPGEEFFADVRGNDASSSSVLITGVPVTRSWASDAGLSAEFDMVAPFEVLNEDRPPGDDIDDLSVAIYVHNTVTGETEFFSVGELHGRY